MALEVGGSVPDFTLTGSLGAEDTDVSLSDYAGKNLIIVFYPLDFSSVCSIQIPDYNEKIEEIRSKNADVIAIRSEEHTSELQSLVNHVCRLLLEKKNDSPNL